MLPLSDSFSILAGHITTEADLAASGEDRNGGPMRYEKAETVLRVALDMQASNLGLSLEEIQHNYSDHPLSRRTAERLRDAIERLFPHLEQANPGEVPKRWRLPASAVHGLANITASELADLGTAVSLLRRENMILQAKNAELGIAKLKALIKRQAMNRIAPDLEALTEAEGLAMRPGPRPKVNPEVVTVLREAILMQRKIKLHYLYRGSRKRGYQIVQPYGFLYGHRHYLVAWSEVDRAKDFRNFALSNIERADLLDTTFVRQSDFSLKEYAQQSFGVFQEQPVDVVWKFSPTAAVDAQEFLFHPSQRIEFQADGSLIVRLRAGGLQEMAWHLVTWGNEVQVLSPPKLLDVMSGCLNNMEQPKGGLTRSATTSRRRP